MMYPDLNASSSRYIVPGDPEWPTGLGALSGSDRVAGLWVMGDGRLNELATKAVAITGARASTGYGTAVAQEMSNQVAGDGYTVVNGGGYGIDAAALRGAIGAGTPTSVILAAGFDNIVPAAHYSLFQSVIAGGGVLVTEYPVGQWPSRVTFLRRSRLIAALASGVVVVEAAARSGARNVADWAAELGRNVGAVPGPVTSATSVLPHRLIRDGKAVMVTSGDDVIEMMRRTNESAGIADAVVAV